MLLFSSAFVVGGERGVYGKSRAEELIDEFFCGSCLCTGDDIGCEEDGTFKLLCRKRDGGHGQDSEPNGYPGRLSYMRRRWVFYLC